MKKAIFFTTVCSFFISSLSAQIIYVKWNSGGSNDRSSWTNAYDSLHKALATAVPLDTVWVAAGTYKPTKGADRTLAFNIPDGVKVFGGLEGSEAASYNLTLRNFITHETILSGNINDQNDSLDNSYHVIKTIMVSNATMIDGFTIREGHADGAGYQETLGGGWLNDATAVLENSNPVINNCRFVDNFAEDGGGIYTRNYLGSLSPAFNSCTFLNNRALNSGGGMYSYDGSRASSPILANCIFIGNKTINNYGGGMYNTSDGHGYASPELINCEFSNNSASYGGGLYNTYGGTGAAEITVSNSTFSNNSADFRGGAIYNNSSYNSITNTNFLNNTAADGAGIYNFATSGRLSGAVLTSCTFTGNIASNNGGAITNDAFTSGYSFPSITKCTFSNNSAISGGAIHFNSNNFAGDISSKVTKCIFDSNGANHIGFAGTTDHKPTFTNCTFYGASVSALHFDSWFKGYSNTNVNFVNSIFWGNNGDINNSSDSYAGIAFQYSAVEEASYAISNTNIFKDPLFIDAPGDNFQVNACSPTIDAGTATNAPVDDILNFTRPYPSGEVDMGAFEFQGKSGAMWYVNHLANSGNNDGSSWSDAFLNLQDALTEVCTQAEIWVASGTYKPTSGSDRTVFFEVPNNYKVYGGFDGTEILGYDLSLRDFINNETILSGDIGTPNDSLDNSYHVIKTEFVSSETTVDGFTIKDGNANGTASNGFGGAWYNVAESNPKISNPTISNCKFILNGATSGGALANNGGYGIASPTVTFCIFEKNVATNGGAIHNSSYGASGQCDPLIESCTFLNNKATAGGGSYSFFWK
jgi:predicted outer membrane repeat protein